MPVAREKKSAQATYEKIAGEMESDEGGVAQAKMFGMPSLKVKGKAFAGFYQDDMVFKLSGDAHAEALSLKGAKLFDPSGRNRPMREWVQVPRAHAKKWRAFAEDALKYVAQSK